MVERGLSSPTDHPAVKDLEPLQGTLKEKWNLNMLGTEETAVLCVRMSRVNHSCTPNATHWMDEVNGVKILTADKDIQAGEEITITYTNYGDPSSGLSASEHRHRLEAKWGIQCPEDCSCRDLGRAAMISEMSSLDAEIMRRGCMSDFSGALRAAKQLLKIYEKGHSLPLVSYQRTLYDAFQMAVTRRSTLPEAKDFIRRAYDAALSVGCPTSEETVKYKEFVEDPSRHRLYLVGGR
eukprot:gene13516-19381_t